MEEKDISEEFKDMDLFAFDKFLLQLERSKRATNEAILVTIRTDNISKAKRLKAIKEDTKYEHLKFRCEIEATIEEYKEELNVFASGVEWIEKK